VGCARQGEARQSQSPGPKYVAHGESFMCVYWVAVPKAMRARRANIGEAGGSYPHLSNSSTHQSFSRDDRFWDED
jgi:hypothetical protein